MVLQFMWGKDFIWHGAYLSKILRVFIYPLKWVYFSALLLLPLLIILFVFILGFDVPSSNIDKVLSINPFYNMFVFQEFKVHHKDWLKYSGGNDRTTLIIFPSQITLLRRLTLLLGSLTVTLIVLFFCTYSSLLKLVFVLR